jgi:hypothetical protein
LVRDEFVTAELVTVNDSRCKISVEGKHEDVSLNDVILPEPVVEAALATWHTPAFPMHVHETPIKGPGPGRKTEDVRALRTRLMGRRDQFQKFPFFSFRAGLSA